MSARKTRARRIVAAGLAGVATALLVALVRFPRVDVVGRSMMPTLMPGDRLALLPLPPRQGRLVVLRDPRNHRMLLVKRCVSVSAEGIWVRGDNPVVSTDSRQFGIVPHHLVIGRPVYRYLPPSHASWALDL